MSKLERIKELSWNRKNAYPRDNWLFVTKIINALCEPFDQVAVAEQCVKDAYFGSKYHGMSVDEIIEQWSNKGKSSMARGNIIDEYTRTILSGGNVSDKNKPDYLLSTFNNFDALKEEVLDREYSIDNKIHKMQYLGSEVWLNSDRGFRGIMDALFWFYDGYVIFDWKNFESPNQGWDKMLGPLSHLVDSDYNKATLQTFLYRYVMEEEYGLPVIGTRIGQINNHGYKIIKPSFAYDSKLMEEVLKFARNKIDNE